MPRRSSRRAVCAALALASVVSLTACGGGTRATVETGPWQEVVAAAENEGSVTFYSVMPGVQNSRLIKAFNEKYPDIDVDVMRGAAELPGRVQGEFASGSEGADVFLYSDPAWFSENDGQFLEVDGPAIDGWEDDAWAVPDTAIIPSAYPYSMFVWNTDRFPDGFRTWDDLRDSSVDGALGLRSDVTISMAGFLDFQEREFGGRYLTDQAGLGPKFYPSVVPMTQAVASGEIGVTNASTPSVVNELKEQGAPIESVVPKPAYWIQWGAAALQKSYRPNAARVFLDFMMSPEGQTAINGDGFGGASRSGVRGALEPEQMTMLDSEHYTPEVVARFTSKFDTWFD